MTHIPFNTTQLNIVTLPSSTSPPIIEHNHTVAQPPIHLPTFQVSRQQDSKENLSGNFVTPNILPTKHSKQINKRHQTQATLTAKSMNTTPALFLLTNILAYIDLGVATTPHPSNSAYDPPSNNFQPPYSLDSSSPERNLYPRKVQHKWVGNHFGSPRLASPIATTLLSSRNLLNKPLLHLYTIHTQIPTTLLTMLSPGHPLLVAAHNT